MSLTAARETTPKHQCESCRERKARLRFRFRGMVKADCDHTLCFKCFRAHREVSRAREIASWRTFPSPSPLQRAQPLDDRQRAHRLRMLEHLASVG